MIPVVVLGCDSNGYGVIRSIARYNKNIPIIGVDFNPKAPGLFSKFLTSKNIISDPTKNEKQTLIDLINISKKVKEKSVVILTSDIFLSFFNKHREELNKFFLFNIPAYGLLNNLLNKRQQYKIISTLNVPLPKTIYLSKNDNFSELKNINFPVFIKGAFSHIWKQHFIEKGFLVEDEKELLEKVDYLKMFNLDLIVQEIIIGPNSNHYKISTYYDRKGEAKLFFTTQKTRQFPCDFGVGSYMKSKRVDELIIIGKKIFDTLNYNGIGSIEFKIDNRDGKFKFIELNPRIWQQNYQATLAGLNFAEYYYKDCINESIEFNDNFLENITYIDTVNDFQSFLVNKKITNENYFDWILQVLKADCYSFFESKDFKPILKSSNYGLISFKYFKTLIKRLY